MNGKTMASIIEYNVDPLLGLALQRSPRHEHTRTVCDSASCRNKSDAFTSRHISYLKYPFFLYIY